jgi:hypothetical protein
MLNGKVNFENNIGKGTFVNVAKDINKCQNGRFILLMIKHFLGRV